MMSPLEPAFLKTLRVKKVIAFTVSTGTFMARPDLKKTRIKGIHVKQGFRTQVIPAFT
jgi:hypothetical protein